jgi:hypothetical protein
MNTEIFINKSNIIHNNKYNYELVNYINSKTKVKIICDEHGIFEQIPSGHLFGKGCLKCSIKNKTLTTDKFIEKANELHNNRFDYSLVNYINSYTKVKIVCKEHGIFEQNPSSHLNGQTCRRCVDIENTLTTKEFIEKANEVHNNKFNYSLVEYINNITDVKIICPTHGVFNQKPSNHLSGNGCNNCSIDLVRSNEYFDKCNLKFNNKYDYSLVNYVNNKTKVDIICPEHGIFQQTMKNHLKYDGCPYCSGKRMNSELYIKNCKLLHNDVYDYSKTEYTSAFNKVIIICKEHGEFKQLAYIHSQGSGCPICKSSKGEKKIISILKDLVYSLLYGRNGSNII